MTHWIQCGTSRDGRTSPKTKKYTTKHDSQRQGKIQRNTKDKYKESEKNITDKDKEKYDETQKPKTRKNTTKHKRRRQGKRQNINPKHKEKGVKISFTAKKSTFKNETFLHSVRTDISGRCLCMSISEYGRLVTNDQKCG